ncbi:MAG: SpoIIE family protein phosphatase [Bacteroidales bacterium]|nr:SpoIIE family protein phosphatase [Bacteroidales bacterium]
MKHIIKILIALLLMIYVSTNSVAQNSEFEIDSATNAIIANCLENSLQPNNLKISDSLLLVAQNTNNISLQKLSYIIKLQYYLYNQDSTAFSIFDKLIEIFSQRQEWEQYFDYSNRKCYFYIELNRIPEAIDYAKQINNEANSLDYKYGMMYCNITLATIYQMRFEYKIAINYLLKAENIAIKNKFENLDYIYPSLAEYYSFIREEDSVVYYLNKAQNIIYASKDSLAIDIFDLCKLIVKKEPDNQKYCDEYLRLSSKSNYEYIIDDDNRNLAKAYYFAHLNDKNNALYLCSQVKDRNLQFLHKILILEMFNDWETAYKTNLDYVSYQDSIRTVFQKYDIAEQDANFNNVQLRKESRNLLKRNRLIINISIISFLVLIFIVLVFSFIKYNKRKKWLEKEVLLKTADLTQKTEEIQQQNIEITNQRDKLEKITKDITASITSASRIQRAAVPTIENLVSIFGECFLLWRPVSIVSGDFYWAAEVNGLKYLAVADCTGHGVPGAFMSMLGISLLNDIASSNNSNQYNAGQILDILKQKVISSLNQKKSPSLTREGMDMALCIIDSQNLKVQYAGAYRPLYLVRNKELTEYKPNKMPIGYYQKNDNFTNNEILVNMGDCLYMFTDGIPDQFGYNGKGSNAKFSTKRLQALLIDNSAKKSTEQQTAIENSIDEWCTSPEGKIQQLDDQLIVGVKIYGWQSDAD